MIYGWSLGSAVAVTLASRVESAALIVEGAPASLVDIGQQQYPFFPVRLLYAQSVRFNPEDRSRPRADTLPHSPEDAVIPIAEGRADSTTPLEVTRHSSKFGAATSTPQPSTRSATARFARSSPHIECCRATTVRAPRRASRSQSTADARAATLLRRFDKTEAEI